MVKFLPCLTSMHHGWAIGQLHAGICRNVVAGRCCASQATTSKSVPGHQRRARHAADSPELNHIEDFRIASNR